MGARFRFNYFLGKCSVGLLTILAVKGYQICAVEILPTLAGYKWKYGISFHLLFGKLVYNYYKTVFMHSGHSTTSDSEVVFNGHYTPCLADGKPRICYRDKCEGRIKQPRSRHCGDCKRDRVEFDHHCPWFDACVSRDTLPSFLITCGLMPIVTLVGALPIIDSLVRNFKVVQQVSKTDAWVGEVFWNRWYAYPPGPIGARFIRYLLGYWSLSGGSVYDIRMDVAATAFAATVVSIVASALLYTVLRGVLVSMSSVDVERRKSYKKVAEKLKEQPLDSHLQKTLKALEPFEYFRQGERVLKVDNRVWDLGWYRNCRRTYFGEYQNMLNEEILANAIEVEN